MHCAQWLTSLHFVDWEHSGISARGYGKEEKNAAEMQRHGMVDEAKAVAIRFETKSAPL